MIDSTKISALLDRIDSAAPATGGATADDAASLRGHCEALGYSEQDTEALLHLFTGDDDAPAPIPSTHVRLDFKAPARKSIELPNGLYMTREWELDQKRKINEKRDYERDVLVKRKPSAER